MDTPENTPKEKGIPEQAQWLLEFVNLPFKPGILSVFRPIVKPLKRTPTKEPEPPKPLSAESIKKLRAYYKNEGFTRNAINERIAEVKRSQSIIDHKGYLWDVENDKPVFVGHDNCYPTREEFNTFLEKHKFPLVGEVSSDLGFPSCEEFGLWNKVFHVFSYLARVSMGIEPGEYEGSQSLAYDLCREHTESNRYSPINSNRVMFYNNLEDTLLACIYAFWERNKDLHSQLRQCQCCGVFWITRNKKGRGKPGSVFCGEVCKKRFHESSREVNKKRVKTIRADNREYQKKEDSKKLVEWLKDKEGYTLKEAKNRAHKLVFISGETFRNYIRRSGQKYGL